MSYFKPNFKLISGTQYDTKYSAGRHRVELNIFIINWFNNWVLIINVWINIMLAPVEFDFIYVHISEIGGLCLMKWSTKAFQNVPYFRNMKTRTIAWNEIQKKQALTSNFWRVYIRNRLTRANVWKISVYLLTYIRFEIWAKDDFCTHIQMALVLLEML